MLPKSHIILRVSINIYLLFWFKMQEAGMEGSNNGRLLPTHIDDIM